MSEAGNYWDVLSETHVTLAEDVALTWDVQSKVAAVVVDHMAGTSWTEHLEKKTIAARMLGTAEPGKQGCILFYLI